MVFKPAGFIGFHTVAVPLGRLPVQGLEPVVEKSRHRRDPSPESALAILQKPPPDAVWAPEQTQATATIYSPFAGTNFLEPHYVKALENSAGHLWVRKN